MSTAPASTRPFRVLGLQQVALGASQRSALEALWVDLLGVPAVGHFTSASENVDEAILALGRGLGRVELDLMQPLSVDGTPRVHTPALHHIGLWIDNLSAAHAWLQAHGVRFAPGGIRKGAAGFDVCFIHPKPSDEFPRAGVGVLIELVQAPAEVIAAFEQSPA